MNTDKVTVRQVVITARTDADGTGITFSTEHMKNHHSVAAIIFDNNDSIAELRLKMNELCETLITGLNVFNCSAIPLMGDLESSLMENIELVSGDDLENDEIFSNID